MKYLIVATFLWLTILSIWCGYNTAKIDQTRSETGCDSKIEEAVCQK